jgi:hypothetical protein
MGMLVRGDRREGKAALWAGSALSMAIIIERDWCCS